MSDPSTFLDDQYRKFIDSCPDDMKRYMAAGLPVDFSSTHDDAGVKIIATTRYPFRVMNFGIGDKEKRVLVYQQPPESP